MTDGYDKHADLMLAVQAEAIERSAKLAQQLKEAFQEFIRTETVEVVIFEKIPAERLAQAFLSYPAVVKPILTACNIAARAVERDLGIKNLDTYKPRLSEQQAALLAGYVKPFLPTYIAVPALCSLDQYFYIDKEIRASKGRWEKLITEALNKFGSTKFKKRHFEIGGQAFELDAATPVEGPILLGVDIKRIEARRDIHKRSDEIVNKAAKLKQAFPKSKFAAVVYYPFVDEHVNVQNRLKSTAIDVIVFAGSSQDSIENAVKTLLITSHMLKS